MIGPHTSVYINPFSTLTDQPKIPDGKAIESLGVGYRETFEVQDGHATEPTCFLLVPALGLGVVIKNDNTSVTNFANDTRACYVRDFETAPGMLNVVGITSSQAEGQVLTLDNQDVAHWRCVSTGMRISLLNPQEEDDGWWDSCVFNANDNASHWESVQRLGTGNPVGTDHRLVPYALLDPTVGIANERSYETGLLRDLHKRMFKCKPNRDDHKFNDTVENYTVESTDEVFWGTTDGYMSMSNGAPTMERMIKDLYDRSFSMILVRCYGRGTSAATPSRYHVDMQGNYEFIYSHTATESKFQSPGIIEKNFKNVAADVRSGSGASMETS